MLAPDTLLQSRYRVVRQLGAGGMGTVYEAIDQRLRNTIALKETHFIDERLRRQFEREAELLASLHHPALPVVIDHFAEGTGQYLVMQYIAGDDIGEMLQQRAGGPFPLEQVLGWADQLLDALDYIHTQQPPVIHRDIKPQNLKITSRGQIILLDFGLAKGRVGQTTAVATSRSVLGYSLAYAPPEQLLQVDQQWVDHLSIINPTAVKAILDRGTDQRSDLYSLGATLLHLVTGKMPPPAPTRALSVWSGKPDPLHSVFTDEVPIEVAGALAYAMALELDERIPSAAAMNIALNAARDSALKREVKLELPPTVISPLPQPKHTPADVAPTISSANLFEAALEREEAQLPGAEIKSDLSEAQKLQLRYWTEFKNYISEQDTFLKPPKPQPQQWMPFAMGRGYFMLAATIHIRDKRIGVNLTISGPHAKAYFNLLHKERQHIEWDLGRNLDWQERPEGKESHISIRHKSDPSDETDWPTQHAWLLEELEAFHQAFAPRIQALNASDYIPSDNLADGEEEDEDEWRPAQRTTWPVWLLLGLILMFLLLLVSVGPASR